MKRLVLPSDWLYAISCCSIISHAEKNLLCQLPFSNYFLAPFPSISVETKSKFKKHVEFIAHSKTDYKMLRSWSFYLAWQEKLSNSNLNEARDAQNNLSSCWLMSCGLQVGPLCASPGVHCMLNNPLSLYPQPKEQPIWRPCNDVMLYITKIREREQELVGHLDSPLLGQACFPHCFLECFCPAPF